MAGREYKLLPLGCRQQEWLQLVVPWRFPGHASLEILELQTLGAALPHPVPWCRAGCSRSTGQMCKFCGCARGQAQSSLLFLEIIGDLLEKQETLGLLVYIFTFLFLFSSSFHLYQSQDV